MDLERLCKVGDLESIKYLVSNGTVFDEWPIRWASLYGQLEVVKFLVSIEVRDLDDWAMCFAAESGHLGVVKYLVSAGANVAAFDNHAICWAAEYGHLEIVKYLVSIGADVTAEENYAVNRASFNGHIKVVKLLLSCGADFKELSDIHKAYFRSLKAFRRWRMAVFRAFFKKTVIPLYYSPGFPGGIRAVKDLSDCICAN